MKSLERDTMNGCNDTNMMILEDGSNIFASPANRSHGTCRFALKQSSEWHSILVSQYAAFHD